MPVCPEAYTPQPAREGEFTYYPNAVMAFTALRKYHGIWDLGPMTLGGDFGQDEKQDHPEGCAGMGSENEAGVCFTFYNDGRVCVYLPKA